jgi:hypothetical protein
MPADPRSVLDSLVKDACDMQRLTGKLPTPAEARREMLPIVERVAKRSVESVLRPQPKAESRRERTSDEQLTEAYKKAAAANGMPVLSENIHIVRGVGDDATIIPARPQTRAQRKDERMRRARLRFLWSLPEWQARLKAVDQFSSGVEAKRRAESQYAQILADAERVFGPYWKRKPRTLYSTGSGSRHGVQG